MLQPQTSEIIVNGKTSDRNIRRGEVGNLKLILIILHGRSRVIAKKIHRPIKRGTFIFPAKSSKRCVCVIKREEKKKKRKDRNANTNSYFPRPRFGKCTRERNPNGSFAILSNVICYFAFFFSETFFEDRSN